MRPISRSRTLSAPPPAVWSVLSDPDHLPRWWPGVQRVEDVSDRAWTKVLVSPKGKTVRADYTLLESEAERRALWRHEVEESPFERILAESLTEIELEPAEGGTRIAVTARIRPRGWARFGTLQLRRATVRQLDSALDGLEAAVGEG
jgi:uncharacterized protein YndB with AHSA1/START domain